MKQDKQGADIFSVAIAMEIGSMQFYRALLEAARNAKMQEFCARSVEDETRHLALFRQMQMEWTASFRLSPMPRQEFEQQQAQVQKDAQADLDLVRHLADEGAMEKVLARAIMRESGAVHFYEQLIKAHPQHADAIGAIIREEDGHLERLQDLAISKA